MTTLHYVDGTFCQQPVTRPDEVRISSDNLVENYLPRLDEEIGERHDTWELKEIRRVVDGIEYTVFESTHLPDIEPF